MDLIIRQSHGLIKISSTIPWDNNPGKTVFTHTHIQYSSFFGYQSQTHTQIPGYTWVHNF